MLKVAKKKTKARAPRNAEEAFVGSEITQWGSITNIDQAIKQNLRHYHYFYDSKFGYRWTLKYLKKIGNAKALKEFNASEAWRNNTTIGGLCKMFLDGAPLDKEKINWIDKNIENEILIHGRKNLKEKNIQKNTIQLLKRSPADIVKEKICSYIGNLEELIDNWEKNKDFNLYEDLTKIDAPYLMAKTVNDYYKPLLSELKAVLLKKDNQLCEAYNCFSIAYNKKFKEFIANIVNDSEKFMNSKKAIRKPRKKKTKSIAAQLSKIKFQKDNKEFKIASVNPEKIIGANVVVLFNSKYKTLTYLTTNSSHGFSVKGTTIQDVDMTNSFKKTLRKAQEHIGDFSSANKARVLKLMNELKTNKNEANGRLSEDVIILKVFQ